MEIRDHEGRFSTSAEAGSQTGFRLCHWGWRHTGKNLEDSSLNTQMEKIILFKARKIIKRSEGEVPICVEGESVDWSGWCFSSYFFLGKKKIAARAKQKPVVTNKNKKGWKMTQLKWGLHFCLYAVSFSIPTTCFPLDFRGPGSRRTPASENQSPC